MLDFAGSDLNMRSVAAQREREVRALASKTDGRTPRGVRAAIAARLARLAIKLDAETVRKVLRPATRMAGGHR